MATPEKIYNVLFLCTGNSARSIMAEALLNHIGRGRFKAYSAGSHPSGRVHPMALELLLAAGLPLENLRSKSLDEYEKAGAPRMDFVFTLCDSAAAEACPVWGHPAGAHWGLPDPPTVVSGTVEREAFVRLYRTLELRIRLFTELPVTELSAPGLLQYLAEIGRK